MMRIDEILSELKREGETVRVAVQKVGSLESLGVRRIPLALFASNGGKGTTIEFEDGIIVSIQIS